jgi:hypothetical protein
LDLLEPEILKMPPPTRYDKRKWSNSWNCKVTIQDCIHINYVQTKLPVLSAEACFHHLASFLKFRTCQKLFVKPCGFASCKGWQQLQGLSNLKLISVWNMFRNILTFVVISSFVDKYSTTWTAIFPSVIRGQRWVNAPSRTSHQLCYGFQVSVIHHWRHSPYCKSFHVSI